jgi:D-glycero-D-manno-heptose 1,7-bisphosphate phosphatase
LPSFLIEALPRLSSVLLADMNRSEGQRKVVILDRDGTIVVDRGYLDDPAGLAFLPGAAEGLRRLHREGYQLVVITNQSGIGRGRFTTARLHEIHTRFAEMVSEAGAPLAGIYFCPHRPDDGCLCRKPELGLVKAAAVELGFSDSAVIVIGDKDSDVELGKRIGAPTVLISSTSEGAAGADFVASDLIQAAEFIERLNAGRVSCGKISQDQSRPAS